MPRVLSRSFYDRHHVDVARELIGCSLHWDGVGGIVVETEAYAATGDPACHTASRPTSRAFFESHRPGTVYVYINYGVHWLLNVLTADGIVLFRALQPTQGVTLMQQRRRRNELHTLCSGPGKLGSALGIGAADHGSSLLRHDRCLKSRPDDFDVARIAADVRVGLSVGLDRPWRFLLRDCPHVSVAAGRAISRRRRGKTPAVMAAPQQSWPS